MEVVSVSSMGMSQMWEQLGARSSACALSCMSVRQLLFRRRVSTAKPLYAAEGLEQGQR